MSLLRFSFLRSFPVTNVFWTPVRFSVVRELKMIWTARSQLQMCLQHNRAPHISVNMWWSTLMSRSLMKGLVVAVNRTGHCGHWTSLPLSSIYGATWKHGVWTNANRRYKLHHQIFSAARSMNDPDVLDKVQNILHLKYLQFCNHWEPGWHSYDILYLNGNDFRNQILKYWHKVSGHIYVVSWECRTNSRCKVSK